MKRIVFLAAIISGFFLLVGATAASAAVTDQGCALLGGSDTGQGTTCTLTGTHNVNGPIAVGEPLQMLTGSKIVTGATGINLSVAGDFVMESGALIDGNVAGCNTGAPINIAVDGNANLKTGSTIRSDSCSGGAIMISTTGAHTANIAGTVESVGSMTGTSPHQRPGGGMIFVNAGCKLTVSDSGIVSSRGKDPGADLVHLAGCSVEIDGLVESTGSGHVLPDSPVNHCNSPTYPAGAHGPYAAYTSCVEIWSATNVLVDGSATHKGQVNADTGQGGGTAGKGWIDIYAGQDITIKGMVDPGLGGTGQFGGGCSAHVNDLGSGHTGCTALDHYAVHANGGLGVNTDDAGLITIVSQSGGIATSGQAIQASSTAGGGDGGDLHIEAAGDIAFGTASVQAKGAATSNGAGGHIGAQLVPVRSYSAAILGALPGELNAAGGAGAGNGSVVILACDPSPTYTGAAVPALTNLGTSCGPGGPTLPSWVLLPLDSCSALFCQIINCQPTPPFSWTSFPPGVTSSTDPGYAAGQRGPYNKDGSACGPVGYSFTNDILDTQNGNTVDLEWDTASQPTAAFVYTMNWKLRAVDLFGWTESQPQLSWLKDDLGAPVYIPGIVCVNPSLPAPYGTTGFIDVGLNPITITIDTTFGGSPPSQGAASLPPVPFPVMIGTERLLVTGLVSGTTYNASRAQGGTTAAAHAAGAFVMSTPLPLLPPTLPNLQPYPSPYVAGTMAHMCVADHGWVAVGIEPVTGDTLIEYSTTIIDIGDGHVRLP
jgi:hypothetical protein